MNAVISIFNNIQCKVNNHNGLEPFYLNKKYNAKFLGKKNRNNKDNEDFIDVDDVLDINNFKNIYIVLSPPNFFGGVLKDDVVKKIKILSKFKGKVYILCNDPRIKPVNAAKVVKDRFNKLGDLEVNDFQKMLNNAFYVFSGKNIKRFYKDFNYNNVVYFDYFKEIFKLFFNENKEIINNNKEYDVLYYGDNRGSFRKKELEKYMPNKERNLIIKHKTTSTLNKVQTSKKLKHEDLMRTINKSKVSLIISDKEHYNNVITFRFYETLNSNSLAAIPLSFDPHRKIIKNDILKNILYVDNKDDVQRIVDNFSLDLLKLQKEEYKRIMKD